MDKFDRDDILFIGTIIIIFIFWGVIFFKSFQLGDYIEKNGLKPIIMKVWEGENYEK